MELSELRGLKPLGALRQVDLRQIWQSEPADFTAWLAHSDNIGLLGMTLGLDLYVKHVEKPVGSFWADIVCEDAFGNIVVIENQLEQTDHKHLGQLLTYSAGVRANTIIWVAKNFRDEHRAAIDWLNNATGQNFNFFAVEIQLWQIGDSLPAPRFNVVSQPNQWSKEIRSSSESEPDPARGSQLEFWTGFSDRFFEITGALPLSKPGRQYYLLMKRVIPGATWYVTSKPNSGLLAASLAIAGPERKALADRIKESLALTPEFLNNWSIGQTSDSLNFPIDAPNQSNQEYWSQYQTDLVHHFQRVSSLVEPLLLSSNQV